MSKHIWKFGLILCLVLSAFAQTSASIPAEAQSMQFELAADPQAGPIPTPTTSASGSLEAYPAEGYGPNRFPENINPLTGLPVADLALLERRPVAVKVSNGPRSIRPQYGLSLADHVWEYYHEVGRTRFHAIFYGQDAEFVGPIRSARFADEHFVHMYKSVFAFGSADARVLWRLFDTGFGKRYAYLSDHPCPPTVEIPLCRIDPDYYNSLMTATGALSEYMTNQQIGNYRQVLNSLHFNSTLPEGSSDSSSLTIRYSSGFYNRWDYDRERGNYIRYQDMVDDYANGNGEIFEILTDKLTGESLHAENIVVILAKQTYYLETPEMWEINLIGSGDAYAFRDGVVYPLKWIRDADESLIQLKFPDGSRYPLKPGSTWFQIVGTSSNITSNGPFWRIVHMMP